MKKFFTILALVAFTAITFSACTEEEVKPSTTTEKVGGGSASSSTTGF
jgi:hypothetical protein